ncbi:MAG: DMT family transporter [Nanoarchaeota archaeon]|nr:DMT family transporter [Nanoarchaeota archaeon]
MKENTKGKIAIIASAIIWGFGFLWVRFLYNADYSVPTIIFGNFILSSLIFFLILKYKKIKVIPQKYNFKWLISLGIVDAITALTIIWAFILTKIAIAEFLHYTMPLWAFVIAVFWLKEKITKWKFLALVVSIIGIFLVFDLSFFRNGFDLVNLGNILALISAVSFGLIVILGRKLKNVSAYVSSFWNRVIGATILFFFFIFDITLKGWQDLPIFLGYALFTSIIPLTLLFYGLRKVEASTGSILLLLEVPTASILAWMVFSESLNPATIIGGILILTSAIILIRKQSKNS